MVRGFFVTGTDTGVGKTTVAVALIRALVGQGLRVAAMKPVAAGCERVDGGLRNEDVAALSDAANVKADPRLVNPYAFAPAIAPHLAAAQAGVEIEIDRIVAALRALAQGADGVVVEGVGGFRVPLGARTDTADLAAALGLPLILVVGLRLGCLNHALLTAEAIDHRGLRWAGWIGNVLDPDMPALDENIVTLAEGIAAPCLGIHPNIALYPNRAASAWLRLDLVV